MTPLIIAHRGDSAHRPENTLASFARALEVGASIVELDVQLTADGQPVVVHDVTLDRTTDRTGDVRRMTLTEVKDVSAGFPARFGDGWTGERVPTLAEALELLRGRAQVMIEIKKDSITDDAASGLEAKTIAAVRDLRMEGEVALISFLRLALQRCRTLAPGIRRGHLFYGASVDEVLAGAREVACDLVMPHKEMLSDELRDRAREAGLRVATWVVDEIEELRALARFDLFGVGSNRPGVLIEALRTSDRSRG